MCGIAGCERRLGNGPVDRFSRERSETQGETRVRRAAGGLAVFAGRIGMGGMCRGWIWGCRVGETHAGVWVGGDGGV
jgi:hypothetical protein